MREAQWISSKTESTNLYALKDYHIHFCYDLMDCVKLGFMFGARDLSNYCKLEMNHTTGRAYLSELWDNQWKGSVEEGGVTSLTQLGCPQGYEFNHSVEEYSIDMYVRGTYLELYVNNEKIVAEDILPPDIPFMPRKRMLMSVGFDCRESILLRFISVQDSNGVYVAKDDLNDESTIMMAYGLKTNKGLLLSNVHEIVNLNPPLYFKYVLKDKEYHGRQVTMEASARGLYYIYVNGKRQGDEFFNPGFTDYRLRILSQQYQITDCLDEDLTIIAVVSPGYYTGFCGYSGPMIYGKENSFIASIVLKDTMNKEIIVPTGREWLYTQRGPVLHADILDGENYDARMLEAITDHDSIWTNARVLPDVDAVQRTNEDDSDKQQKLAFELTSLDARGAHITDRLPYIEVKEPVPGRFVYDLGQNMVGTIRVVVRAKRGQTIRIRYGEMCYQSGEIYIKNIRSAYGTDTYICRGDSDEEYIPIHTFHGFRYVEITGLENVIKEDNIISLEGLVICNVDRITGSFSCSNPLLNQLQHNILWGQKGNFLLVPTDCPQRNERMGWTGDIQVFARTAAFNMDVSCFLNKWLLDLRDSQLLYNKKGAVPDTAPLGGDNRLDGCAGWGDAAVIVPWEMYVAYGDIRYLQDNYEMMKRWVDYQSLEERQNCGLRTVNGQEKTSESDFSSEPFIQVQQRRGDHLTFDETTPFILSATAYAAHVASLLTRTAKILGNEEDEIRYSNRYNKVCRAFREAWVKEDGTIGYWGEMSKSNRDTHGNPINCTYYSNETGNPNHPSQTAYALAIDFGLIPSNKLGAASRGLKTAIEDANGHITTGFLGISHLHYALSKTGLWKEAFDLLEQKGNPGWLYSVINGATTIWERWDSYIAESGTFQDVSMNSFNHYSYGAIGAWMYECILGIRPSDQEMKTGYRNFYIQPHFGGTLTKADGYHDTQYGRIEVHWEVKENNFHLECCVPSNTVAILVIPAECLDSDNENVRLTPGNHYFDYPIRRDKM